MTANELVRAALLEVGTAEYPPGSNRVKYNDEYYGAPVSGAAYSWCLVFVWWLCRKLGASRLFYGGGRCASCTAFYRWHEARGETVTRNFRPGDIVFYDWDASGDFDHVGILCAIEGERCACVEGNTSAANNSDGGSVMLRQRSRAQIKGAVRLKFEEEEIVTAETILAALTDGDAYKIFERSQSYAARLPAPDWALGELDEAVNAGITDGARPMCAATRLEAAIMANRAR
jgi:hypothetical protein